MGRKKKRLRLLAKQAAKVVPIVKPVPEVIVEVKTPAPVVEVTPPVVEVVTPKKTVTAHEKPIARKRRSVKSVFKKPTKKD